MILHALCAGFGRGPRAATLSRRRSAWRYAKCSEWLAGEAHGNEPSFSFGVMSMVGSVNTRATEQSLNSFRPGIKGSSVS